MKMKKAPKRTGQKTGNPRKQKNMTKKPRPTAKSSARKKSKPAKKNPPRPDQKSAAKKQAAPPQKVYQPFHSWLTPAQINLRSVKGREGVLVETLDENNVLTLTGKEIQEHFDCGKFEVKSGGFAIPYYDLTGNPVIDEGSEKKHKGRWYVRIRLDKSFRAKYLQSPDTTTHPYFPKGLDKLKVTDLVLVEGEMKALSLVEAGFPAIGIGGFYGWSREGKLVPEIRAALKKLGAKRVLFLGDNDTSHNWQFADAAVKLCKELDPLPLLLPRIPLSEPKGIDDVKAKLKRDFNKFWKRIVSKAYVVTRKLSKNDLAMDLLETAVEYIAAASESERVDLFRRVSKIGANLDKASFSRFLKICARASFDEQVIKEARAIVQSTFKKKEEKTTPAEAAALKARLESLYKGEPSSANPTTLGIKKSSVAAPQPIGALAYILLPSNGITEFHESARGIFTRLAATGEYYLLAGKITVLEPSKHNDQLEFSIMSADMIRSRLPALGTLVRYKTVMDTIVAVKKAQPGKDEISTIMTAREANILPRITAIHNSPIVVDDGEKLCVLTKGYHKEAGGRYITEGDVEFVSLDKAVELIRSIFAEFHFVSESDRSRAISALITPAMHFGELVKEWETPIFIVEADDSQAGKGYLLQLIQQVYNEQCSMVTKREGGVGSIDESLSGALITGKPFIVIDNYKGVLDSSYLEAILTCPIDGTVQCRVPFQGEVRITPHPFIFQLTTNGFSPTSDLRNRMCLIRILKRSGYLFKEYEEGSLRAHVIKNRRRLLGAIFAVISKWYDSGKPKIRDARGEGNFREWWEIMNWIMKNIFQLPSPLDDHTMILKRLGQGDQAWLEQVARAFDDAGQCGARQTATTIAQICSVNCISAQTAAGISPVDGMLAGQILARIFSSSESRLIDGYRVTRRTEQVTRTAKSDFVTTRYYIFQRTSASSSPVPPPPVPSVPIVISPHTPTSNQKTKQISVNNGGNGGNGGESESGEEESFLSLLLAEIKGKGGPIPEELLSYAESIIGASCPTAGAFEIATKDGLTPELFKKCLQTLELAGEIIQFNDKIYSLSDGTPKLEKNEWPLFPRLIAEQPWLETKIMDSEEYKSYLQSL